MIYLDRKRIADRLRLPEQHIILDEAIYDPIYPDDIELLKHLTMNDHEFAAHIVGYPIYPDYAITKIINQGIRLLISLLYPDSSGIPVGMVERTRLRSQLYPDDQIVVLIKKWQERSKIAKFEIGIENQHGKLVCESTVIGTLIAGRGRRDL